MILTEAEAAERWCPFVRVEMFAPDPALPHAAVNRSDCNINCLGSRCMAWRWVPNGNAVVEDGDGPLRARIKRALSTHGYCGLAGKV